jgi:hypothetical protein
METSASFEARYAPLLYPTNHVLLVLIRRVRLLLGDTAMSALRIQELRKHASEILFRRRHAELHTFAFIS